MSEEEGLNPANLREKYLRVRKLIVEESKKDPPEEPYKSKYKAREILEEMKLSLNKVLGDEEDEVEMCKEKAQLCVVYFYLGSLAVDVQELSTGEEYLTQALSILKGHELHSDCVICVVSTLNQEGLLWCLREQEEKAYTYLEKAEKIYRTFKELPDISPTDFYKLFTGEPSNEAQKNPELKLEELHTYTLFFLAQVYKTLGKPLKSAQYCHWTLTRQLKSVNFDKIDWAINSATLSQFLLEKDAFKSARHHLAAASAVLDLRKQELDFVQSEEDAHLADLEQLQHRRSDVARCWAKYGLCLLTTSKNRLMESDMENGSREVFQIPEELEELWFPSLELGEYEEKVSSDFLLTFDDARPVFIFSRNCLSEAKEFYTLEDHASDYVSIQQDLSRLYESLAFFEDDEGRQCKMHKKRIDILSSLLQEISPVHYLQATRELLFELGETYTKIMDIKDMQASESENRTTHGVMKHNTLCQKAVEAYSSFINTFRNKRTNCLPEAFPEEFERPALLAHLYSARLYTKMMILDRITLLENHKKALDIYKFIVDYCTNREEGKSKLEGEYQLCVEMANLLPLKISKIAQANE